MFVPVSIASCQIHRLTLTALNRKVKFVLILSSLQTSSFIPPVTECGKVMFSVVSVCPPGLNLFTCSPPPHTQSPVLPADQFNIVHWETPLVPVPDMFKPAHSDTLPLPKSPVRACSLCNRSLHIYRQAGGRPSTERRSCIVKSIR